MATLSLQQSLAVVRPTATTVNCKGGSGRQRLVPMAKYSLQALPAVTPLATSFVSHRRCSNGYCCRQTRMLTITNISTRTDPSTLTSPWLMLPSLQGEGGTIDYKFYSLAEKKVITFNRASSQPYPDAFRIGSSHGWVASINRRDCSLFMFNPMTGRNIKLPSIRTLPILQIGKCFYAIRRFFLSSAYPDDAENCRALIFYLPITPPGKCPAFRLAFCSPATCETDSASASWTLLDSPLWSYSDVVYSPKNQKFFCVDKTTGMEAWDLANPSSPTRHAIEDDLMVEQLILDGEYRCGISQNSVLSLVKEEEYLKRYFCFGHQDKSYLVLDPSSPGRHFFLIERFIVHDSEEGLITVPRPIEEVGKGYLVDGGSSSTTSMEIKQDYVLPYKTISFDVYKIDAEKKVVKYMKSLGDRAFFVGLNQSIVLSAKDFPELEPNSVYFTDDRMCTSYESKPFGGHDVGIYNYKDKTIEECYYSTDIKKIAKVEPFPVWLTPNWDP